MNQFVLQYGTSGELNLFPHIFELGAKRNTSIQLNGFQSSIVNELRIYYVSEGKFEWCIGGRKYLLYPGDTAFVLPGKYFGSEKGVLEIGSFCWLHLKISITENNGLQLGKWSNLSKAEQLTVGKIIMLNNTGVIANITDAGKIFQKIQSEIQKQEIGFQTIVNHLTDELLILIARLLIKQTNAGRDFPKTFMDLEQALRKNLSHQWTVEEMAALVGMGATIFNEKVKNYTGFTPISYLINIRIAEAIKMLRKPAISLTDIALDTGFYSSQHFSTTFKKLTGYTPSEFRKNHLPKT